MDKQSVAVLGAGAWGTALAMHVAQAGHQVVLWSHDARHATALSEQRENKRYLPGCLLPDALQVTASLSDALQSAQSILVVVPSDVFESVLLQVKPLISEQINHLAWATKGFEPGSQKLLHQIAQQVLGDRIGLTVLSGPTFADEVAKGLPTAMVSASEVDAEASYWADLFHFGAFRMYTQNDIAGVEVGGAYKNIMAIATGLSDGLGLGANARAALISRGMVEMMRLGQALGAQPETLMGLAGLGDLVLTCTDDLSRNRRFGKQLAKTGASAQQVMDEIGQVVEGVKAVKTVKALAQRLKIDLPIMEQVYLIVTERATPKEAVQALLARSGKSE